MTTPPRFIRHEKIGCQRVSLYSYLVRSVGTILRYIYTYITVKAEPQSHNRPHISSSSALSLTMTRMILLIQWIVSFVSVAAAHPVRTTMVQRRRYVQQQQPTGDQDSSLTPFTHSVRDYYTDPNDTNNGDDDDDTTGGSSHEISIKNLPHQEQLSIVTIIWITACVSVVLLLSLCILLGTTKRHRRRIHQQQQQHQELDESIPMDTITTIHTSKTKSPLSRISFSMDKGVHFNSSSNINSNNDVEEGKSNSRVPIPEDDNDGAVDIGDIRNTANRRSTTHHQRHQNHNNNLENETDTTTSSDTMATADASSSSSLSLS